MFDNLGVPGVRSELPSIGDAVESAVVGHLRQLRPDITIGRSRPAVEFDQYRHLGVSSRFAKSYSGDRSDLQRAIELATDLPATTEVQAVIRALSAAAKVADTDDQRVQELINTMPEESLLKLDIAITAPSTGQRLLIGVSSKWSLRTDRAQDCIAQGGKLVNLRRGQMPHYAVLTMEPRPAMLKLLAYGSGSLDCIYHLALDELMEAANSLATKKNKPEWPQKLLLERMVSQGRIRPYGDMVDEVVRLPE